MASLPSVLIRNGPWTNLFFVPRRLSPFWVELLFFKQNVNVSACMSVPFHIGKTGPFPQNGSFIPRIFPEYFRVFPYHEKHFHTMELDKTVEIGFSNLSLQYFQNISIPWKDVQFFPLSVLYFSGKQNRSCEVDNGGCEHICSVVGEAVLCTCRPGYERFPSSRTCQDVDECAEFGTCSQRCVNTKGSYKCLCSEGFVADSGLNGTCRARGKSCVQSSMCSVTRCKADHKTRQVDSKHRS